jgi:hypothetical protein
MSPPRSPVKFPVSPVWSFDIDTRFQATCCLDEDYLDPSRHLSLSSRYETSFASSSRTSPPSFAQFTDGAHGPGMDAL